MKLRYIFFIILCAFVYIKVQNDLSPEKKNKR